jgi:hypothetical protein
VTKKLIQLLVMSAGAVAGGAPHGATIRDVAMDHDGTRYRLTSSTYVDAPREAVFRVLTDYEKFDRISSVYTESRYLPPDTDGTTLVYTRLEGCVLFFCKSVERVERMETEEPGFIRTTADPARSDFRYARSEWHLEPERFGTNVIYEMELEPDFWVPPLIGPWIIKRRLLRGGIDAVDRIEGLARQMVVGQSAATP